MLGRQSMKHVLNQYFDRIYCITVHTFTNRHQQVREQLKGIDFEWAFSPLPEWLSPSPAITPTEKSLTIGIFNAIQNAKFHKFNRILIWEDDGILSATEEEIGNFLGDIPKNWDALYMGGPPWAEKLWPFAHEEYSQHAYRVLHGNGNACLGIQSHVYVRLLNGLSKFNAPADFRLNTLFKRRNSYAPKKFFSSPNSKPDIRYFNRFTAEELAACGPSYIVHTV